MKTYRECCMEILQGGESLTCAQIIKRLPPERITGALRYMTATISGVVRKLVKEGYLEYADRDIKGPRGGHTYKIKKLI